MQSNNFLSQLGGSGLVAVVRGESAKQAMLAADACFDGGLRLIELTFTVPDAEVLIAEVKNKYRASDLVLGAGTVRSVKQAAAAVRAGASYVVSPSYNAEVAEYCRSAAVPYVPGVFTPTEVDAALNAGATVLKLFPGDIATPKGLKALLGPFPEAKFMVTGGVSYDNLEEWFKAGAIAVGAGSNLTKGALTGNSAATVAEAEKWINKINQIKNRG